MALHEAVIEISNGPFVSFNPRDVAYAIELLAYVQGEFRIHLHGKKKSGVY